MGFHRIYPLVNVYITAERSTILNGKTHKLTISTGPYSIAMLNYQRVCPHIRQPQVTSSHAWVLGWFLAFTLPP